MRHPSFISFYNLGNARQSLKEKSLIKYNYPEGFKVKKHYLHKSDTAGTVEQRLLSRLIKPVAS